MTEAAPTTYVVTVLDFGSLTVDPASQVRDRAPGSPIDVPVWGALIEGGGRRLLVDTGLRDPAAISERLGPAHQCDRQRAAGALDELGLRPSDVDTVINTHLHFDHCGQNADFPDARFVVSRREWEFALDPNHDQSMIFAAREFLAGPLTESSYTLLDEDEVSIADGITVIATPGHTPGHRSVLVRTAEGVLCIAGDAVNVEENLVRRVPNGTVTSLPDAVRSIELIRARADRILTAHDPRLRHLKNGDFPIVPAAATSCPC